MNNRIKLLLWVALASFVTTSGMFWFFEHGHNPNIKSFFDVLWWWIVTSATVGYGDIVPLTWQGRAVAIITIVLGFYIFANMVAIIAESIHAFVERKSLGTAQIAARNHIVLCDYTAITDEIIQSLPLCPELADKEVVIISDLVSRNPYPQHQYVRGVPINPAALKQANVEYADYVFVFANLRFADPDVKTMHIASRVLELNDRAKVFVEMVDPRHDLLKYASGKLISMDSRKLIEMVLRNEHINPMIFMDPSVDQKS